MLLLLVDDEDFFLLSLLRFFEFLDDCDNGGVFFLSLLLFLLLLHFFGRFDIGDEWISGVTGIGDDALLSIVDSRLSVGSLDCNRLERLVVVVVVFLGTPSSSPVMAISIFALDESISSGIISGSPALGLVVPLKANDEKSTDVVTVNPWLFLFTSIGRSLFMKNEEEEEDFPDRVKGILVCRREYVVIKASIFAPFIIFSWLGTPMRKCWMIQPLFIITYYYNTEKRVSQRQISLYE